MSIFDFEVLNKKKETVNLKDYEGKVCLVINSATGCGFTPQYKELEALYEKYSEKGFMILDFPCNQFANQAPGTDDEIQAFCTAKYNTKFEQLNKIDVNGENEDPLFTYLKKAQPKEEVKGLKNKIAMKAIYKISKTRVKESDISWNFTKFLVDKEGNVVKRYDPTSDPISFKDDIEKLL